MVMGLAARENGGKGKNIGYGYIGILKKSDNKSAVFQKQECSKNRLSLACLEIR